MHRERKYMYTSLVLLCLSGKSRDSRSLCQIIVLFGVLKPAEAAPCLVFSTAPVPEQETVVVGGVLCLCLLH